MRSRFRTLLVLVLLLWLSAPAMALTPEELAKDAETLYREQKFAEAGQKWQELSGLGYANEAIYYNLSNAYWRQGRTGEAKLYLLKAKALAPRDSDIRYNLSYIDSKLEKTSSEFNPLLLIKRLPFYKLSLSFTESLSLAAIFSLLFFGALTLTLLKKKTGAYRILSGILGFLFTFSMFQLMARYYEREWLRPAIVLAPQSPLLELPVSTSNIRAQLDEASEVRILKRQGDFFLVESVKKDKGWMAKDSVGEI